MPKTNIVQSEDKLVVRQEILAWWSQERGRISFDCATAAAKLTFDTFAKIDQLPFKQLCLPSRQRRQIETQLNADLIVFCTDLAKSLEEHLENSIDVLEGASENWRNDAGELAMLTAGGATAVASIGATAVASTVATTTVTTSFIGLVTTGTFVTFSWPVFGAVLAGATTLAVVSPTLLSKAQKRMRSRFKAHVESAIQRTLLDSEPRTKTASVQQKLLEAIDDARDVRLRGLE